MENNFSELMLGFETERRQTPQEIKNFDHFLREAEFTYEICGSFCAKFKREYLERVKTTVGGNAQTYLRTALQGRMSTHSKDDYVFMSQVAVDYIIAEIDNYIGTGKWNDVSKEA